MVGRGGRRDSGRNVISRSLIGKRLAWPAVETGSDGVEIIL